MAEEDRVATRVSMLGIYLGEFQGLAPIGKRVEDVRPSTCSMSPVGRSWSTGETATIRPTSCPSLVFLTFRERRLSAIHDLA
jgi:predicted ester cyclase